MHERQPDVLRIADLVARPDLRLAVVAGHENLDRPVEAAHVSELLTPGQWLQGGELLMTIGLLLPTTDDACARYVADAAADGAGACGLVLGLGRDLPHQSAPEPLARAARNAGMPLLTVPDEVPFIAVTKAVFAAKAALQRRALERAFDAQRRLTVAAASGQGLTATLRAWTAATGVDAAVTDPLGRLIADAATRPGTDPAELLGLADDLIRRVAARGLLGSGSMTLAGESEGEEAPGAAGGSGALSAPEDFGATGRSEAPEGPGAARRSGPARASDASAVPGASGAPGAARGSGAFGPGAVRHLEVLPLGAERLRGLLVLGGRVDADARVLASGLVALLSLELERRHLADEPERRRRAARLGRLLAPGITSDQARDVLAATGLAAPEIRGLAVTATPGPDAADLAADLALALPGGLVRAVDATVEAVCGADIDVFDLLSRFAPGRPAGIGPVVVPHAVAASVRQARALLPLSREAGRPMDSEHGASSALLLGLADPSALAAYADTVLGPLELADPTGELTTTLEAWLESGGSWDETARRLGVHRHTVRNRVDKAMTATARTPAAPGDRFDLWLALRIRRQTA